jgi:ATP-dependent DNA helicase RecQ
VLIGNDNEKTQRFGHTDMPVFGAGKDLPMRTWQSVYRQLLAAGLIRVDHDAFGALKLEPEARAVFRHERQVRFRKDRPTGGKADRNLSTRAKGARAELDDADAALFEALRRKRTEIAKELSIPPYVVFADTTLVGFATLKPMSLEAMLEVSGVGQTKLERYGDAFLEIIQAHE